MSIGLLGKKIGMTRVFDKESGNMIPVTVVDVADNRYIQVKTQETDGYSAVQVGYDTKKESRVNAPALGHFKKHGAEPAYFVSEFRVESDDQLPNIEEPHPGAELFAADQWVDVIGTTKGKGFQGVMRRHNFSGQPMSHGHMMHRRPGAVGAGSTPARIWKNQAMPGHQGVVQRTVQNLKVVAVRPEDNVILISGSVPGHNGAYVVVRPAKKKDAPKG
ncbi:50S ribosomal protein L3 [Sulfuriroseicoccus oceanibius]|uniref:Large ribosomal subunit protein uL3 n=1 Tax=Sulfuriroseicoccus oceanibius TaxID=2707525 RepID=A0A6B3LEI3_9BACT|nr:50S ribosomal protein L3 [Sulfuriroseicoccus oceanibius]QQL45820.1 50S ribosomal protein L3 [Sulfuriroseicoccus oceanibius]